MGKRVNPNFWPRAFFFLGCLCVAIFLYVHFSLRKETASQRRESLRIARQETKLAAQKIERKLTVLSKICLQAADSLSRGEIAYSEIHGVLRKVMQEHPEVFGFGVAFRPNAYRAGTRLFAPYFVRRNGVLEDIQIEDTYDYSELQYRWFHDPLVKGPIWNEPYFGTTSQAMLAEYAAPFTGIHAKTGKLENLGIVFINYSVNELRTIVNGLNLGKLGYATIVSGEGKYIFHPAYENVVSGKNFLKVSPFQHLEGLQSDIRSAMKDQVAYWGRVSEFESLVFQPIAKVKWFLVVVANTGRNGLPAMRMRRHYFLSILILQIALIGFLLFTCVRRPDRPKSRWKFVGFLAFYQVLAVGSTWAIAQKFPDDKKQSLVFQSKQDLVGLRKRFEIYDPKMDRRTIFVPTGIYLEKVKWKSNHDIHLSGYVWQKYSTESSKNLEMGFIFSDVVETESEELEHISSKEDNDITRELWRFKVVLRQALNYQHYPFDYQHLRMRITPKLIGENVVFVPDFDAYKSITSDHLPGLGQVHIPGWEIKKSYFAWELTDFATNFGVEEFLGQENYPTYSFNIVLKRAFFSPFVSHIVPVTVVAVMLFILMLLMGDGISSAKSGFTVLASLGTTAGLFFVLIMLHIDIRRMIQSTSFVYLEILYFMMYCVMLMIALFSVIFAVDSKVKLRGVPVSDLLNLGYWPVLLSTLQAMTFVIFY